MLARMDGCVLSIAHRLTTIKDSDMIVVIKDGKCVEHGTHEDLMVRWISRELCSFCCEFVT